VPGATQRLMLAMRFGYGGLTDVPRPAEVRRAVVADQLMGGSGAAGRLGDWVIENGYLVAIVRDVDGSARGGQLVDLARRKTRTDDLERFEVQVLGRPVRYDALQKGFDDATGAAYIQVSGHPEGKPGVNVTTRYDVGIELDAVVVHTQVQGFEPSPLDAPGDASPVVSDLLIGASSNGATGVVSTADHIAWLGPRAGYVVRPLAEDAFTTEPIEGGVRASFGVPAEEAAAGVVLFSRAITPLVRPDTAALDVALARARGRGVGEVEVRLAGRAALSSARGDISFARPDGTILWASGIEPSGVPAAYVVSLPVGSYDTAFQGTAFTSQRPAPVVIAKNRTSTVDVRVAPQ